MDGFCRSLKMLVNRESKSYSEDTLFLPMRAYPHDSEEMKTDKMYSLRI